MKKKDRLGVPSPAEFDALPESVQRKYFSSLERLRIEEQQQQQQQQHSLQEQEHYERASSRRSSHAASGSLAIHRRSIALGSSRRRLRKAESLRLDYSVAQADAQFFFSLPDKLKKSQFSREEQVLLVGRCEQQQQQQLSRGVSATPSQPTSQRFEDFRFDFYDDAASPIERGRSRRRSSSASSSVSPSRPSTPRSQQEKEQEAESSLLYLDPMSPPLSYQAPASGFRRTLSLSSMPLRTSTSSAPLATEPPLSSWGWHQRAHSQSLSGRRSSHCPVAPVFDPEATHYRDPEARKKLRMYLASPQKFDEAVEFGFPASAGNDSVGPRYQLPPIKTDARNFSRDMQTFLKDDRISFLEDNEEDKGLESDGDSLADLDSPVTPSSTGLSFRCHTRHVSSNFSSMDSNGLPPAHPMGGRVNREMTLRMTLTRPDLRADEDQLYGWQAQKGTKDDPFALEELHLTDDMTGSKGPFYVKPKPHGNLVSRLFKRASRKGR